MPSSPGMQGRCAGTGASSGRSLSNLSLFPEELGREPKKTFGDYLSKTSMSIHMGANLLLWASPLIAKKAFLLEPLRPILAKAVSRPKANQWFHILNDADAIKHKLQRIISAANLFQLNTGWQVGIHTQQPSKSLASITCAASHVALMAKPSVGFLQALSYLGSFFWFAGETNDIKNNVDPAHRREWDLRRAGRALLGQSGINGLKSELSSMTRFIIDDCRYAFSFRPWKDFYHALREKTDWRIPQSYQTAIGAACNLAAFSGNAFAAMLPVLAKRRMPDILKSKVAESAIRQIISIGAKDADKKTLHDLAGNAALRFSKLMACFSVISYAPVAVRALQDWKEKENFMTLLGVPLTSSYMAALSSRDISTWKGFFSIGSPMINEGKRLNAKRYRAQVNYLCFLTDLSRRNPQLTARDILNNLTSQPDKLATLEKHMGKIRVDYLLKKLQEGAREQSMRHITLHQYLTQMMQDKSSAAL